MKTMTLAEYHLTKPKNKIVSFSVSSCTLCNKMKEELADTDFIFITADNEEDLMVMNISVVPYTAVHDHDGKPVYAKAGFLFDKQIAELNDRFKTMMEKQK